MPSQRSSAEQAVLGAIQRRAPLKYRDAPLPWDRPLGPGGLGLDSIAIVELLVECEQVAGCRFPATMFEGGALTIGAVVEAARPKDS